MTGRLSEDKRGVIVIDLQEAEEQYILISKLNIRHGTGYLETAGSWKDIMYKELRRTYGSSNREYLEEDTESSLFLRVLINDQGLTKEEAVSSLEDIEKCYDILLSSMEKYGTVPDKKNIQFLDIFRKYQDLSQQKVSPFNYRVRIQNKAKSIRDLLETLSGKVEKEHKLAAIVAEDELESMVAFKMAVMTGRIRLPDEYQLIADRKFEQLKTEYIGLILADLAMDPVNSGLRRFSEKFGRLMSCAKRACEKCDEAERNKTVSEAWAQFINDHEESVPMDRLQNFINEYIYSQLVPREHKLHKILELKKVVGDDRHSILYKNERYVLSWNDDKETGKTKWIVKTKTKPYEGLDEELQFSEEPYLLVNEIKSYYGFFGQCIPNPDFASFIDNAYNKYYFIPVIAAQNRLYGDDSGEFVEFRATTKQMLRAIEEGKFVVLYNYTTLIGPGCGINILVKNSIGQLVGFRISPRESHWLNHMLEDSLEVSGDYNLRRIAVISAWHVSSQSMNDVFEQNTGSGTCRSIFGSEYKSLIGTFWDTDRGKSEYVQTNDGAVIIGSMIKMFSGERGKIEVSQDIDHKMFVDPTGRKSLIRFEKVSEIGNAYNIHHIMDDGKHFISIKYKNVRFELGRFFASENSMIDSPRYQDRDSDEVRTEELKVLHSQLSYCNQLMGLCAMSAQAFTKIAYPLICENADVIDRVMDILASQGDFADVVHGKSYGTPVSIERLYEEDHGKLLMKILRADLESNKPSDADEYEETSVAFDAIEDIIDHSSEEDDFLKILLILSHRILDTDSEDSLNTKSMHRKFAIALYESISTRIERQIGIMTDFAHGSMEEFIAKHFGRADSEDLFKTIGQWILDDRFYST